MVKRPKYPSNQISKRSLERIMVSGTGEFHCLLSTCNNKWVSAEVTDFHAFGLGLKLSTDDIQKFKGFHYIDYVNLFYGNKKIAEYKHVEIKRIAENGSLGLSLANTLSAHGHRADNRLKVSKEFKPTVIVNDPYKLDQVLHLTIEDLTANGMLLRTSMSNKHLVIGTILKNAQILLPGIKVVTCSLMVRRASVLDTSLSIGVVLENPSHDFLEAITQFSMFGIMQDDSDQNIDFSFVMGDNSKKLKKLGSALRIESVNSLDEYLQALKVRHISYGNIDKIYKTASIEEMADEFDERAIILVAKFKGKVVGTTRLVECLDELDRFPFESYIPKHDFFSSRSRYNYYEVSRLSIIPGFQGTDIIIRFFKEIARYILLKKIGGVCVSTEENQKNYQLAGWKLLPYKAPHPVRKDLTLSLMYIDDKDFVNGKRMSALAWDKVTKDVVNHLVENQVLEKPRFNSRIFFMRHIEKLYLKLKKKRNNKKAA